MPKRFRPSSTNFNPKPTAPVAPIVDDALYSYRQVAKFYGVHPVTAAGWVRKGIISPPIKVGPNTTRFLGRTINHDIAKKLQGKIFVA